MLEPLKSPCTENTTISYSDSFCSPVAASGAVCEARAKGVDAPRRVVLPNGWALSPVGTLTALGALPLNIAVWHSHKLLAITNNGQSTQSIMPMERCFYSIPPHAPYVQRPCNVELNEVNQNKSKAVALSQQFDFSKEDRAPDALFNQVLSHAVKGANRPCLVPVHAAFFTPLATNDADD